MAEEVPGILFGYVKRTEAPFYIRGRQDVG